jgi:N-acetylneuraminate synthase
MTEVVAELGVSHLGDIDKARKLIDAAAAAGCWGVKTQVREPEVCYSKEKLDSYYESPFGTTYREWAFAREFNVNQHHYLMNYAREKELRYGFSVWDEVSAKKYAEIRPDFVKLPSAKIRDLNLLSTIIEKYSVSELHVSTGGSELKDVDAMVVAIRRQFCERFVLYHCVMAYPMEPCDACLSLIGVYALRYKKIKQGYSDHSSGLHVPFAAAMLGAEYIEKHICLDRAAWGPDNASSLEPEALKKLVRNIKAIPDMIGDSVKRIRECERKDVNRLVKNT